MNRSTERRRRKPIALLVGALALFARPSWASCGPPEIGVDRRAVDAGGRIVVSGSAWADGCPEPREGGCGRDEPRERSALTDIEVTLVPRAGAGSPVVLGSLDAGEDYGFELEAVVPKSTPPGRYTIEARSGDAVNEPPVAITVTNDPSATRASARRGSRA